jgi:hypothetical protein
VSEKPSPFGPEFGKRALPPSLIRRTPIATFVDEVLHTHRVTVRTSEEYETPAKRHLRLLDGQAPTGRAVRRFLAQQRAAYARADAALLRKVEAEVQAKLRAKLRALEGSLLWGNDGANHAGDAVAEGRQGPDRPTARPGRR